MNKQVKTFLKFHEVNFFQMQMWLRRASTLVANRQSSFLKASTNAVMTSSRNKVTTITGAIMAKPGRLSWGRLIVSRFYIVSS